MAVSIQVPGAGARDAHAASLEFGPRHLAGACQNWRRQVSVSEGTKGIGGDLASGTGPVLFGGGAMEQEGLRLAGVARGGGPLWGAGLGRSDSGSEMKSLRKLAGKCPPPPALGSATLQVWREVGSWARALSRGRWRAWPSGGRGLRGCPADARGEDQGPGPTYGGGTLRLKGCGVSCSQPAVMRAGAGQWGYSGIPRPGLWL